MIPVLRGFSPWLVLLLATAGPALAGEGAAASSSADLAERAATAHERHCSDVSSAGATKAAQAMQQVVPLLAEVSETWDRTKEPFLLYWRGMLQQCLGQEDRAISDLQAYVALAGSDPVHAAPVAEARRRLARLGHAVRVERPPPRPGTPGVVVGSVLLGAGGVLGGFSGWKAQRARIAQGEFDAGQRPWSATVLVLEEGQAEAEAANGFLAGAVASGVGGVVAMVVAGAVSKGAGGRVAAAVTPLEGGAVLTVGGAW
jgi:hypothetical protein